MARPGKRKGGLSVTEGQSLFCGNRVDRSSSLKEEQEADAIEKQTEPSAVLTTSPVTLLKCVTEVMTWYPPGGPSIPFSLSLFLSFHTALPKAPRVLFQAAPWPPPRRTDSLGPRRLHHPGLLSSAQRQGVRPSEPDHTPSQPPPRFHFNSRFSAT